VVKNVFTLNIEDAELNKISSRKQDYVTVEAVTLRHFQEYNFDDIVARKQFDLLREYTLKVPVHLAKKNSVKQINDTSIYVLDLGYNAIEGLLLSTDDSHII
jgi:hypothetical protein